MMKTIRTHNRLAAALACAVAIIGGTVARAANKPNIVFILADNPGYGEIGCYGGGLTRGAATSRIGGLANMATRIALPPLCLSIQSPAALSWLRSAACKSGRRCHLAARDVAPVDDMNPGIIGIWQEALAAPTATEKCWLHGDLQARNVLTRCEAIALTLAIGVLHALSVMAEADKRAFLPCGRVFD